MTNAPIVLALLLLSQAPDKTDLDEKKAAIAKAAATLEAKHKWRKADAQQAQLNDIIVQMGNRKQLILEPRESADEPPDREGEEDDRPLAFRVGPIDLDQLALARKNFDNWVFGNDLPDERHHRDRLNALLADKIESVRGRRDLNAEQLVKLRLAGSGDVKRLFDFVQDKRDEFETSRKSFNTGRATLNRLGSLAEEIKEGPFGVGSLYEKTLRKFLNEGTAALQPAK